MEMLRETFHAMEAEMGRFESKDLSLLRERHSEKEEALMLRLEKQLARYVLMSESLLEEFHTLEAYI